MASLNFIAAAMLTSGALMAAVPARAADRMQAGLWEMSMPGGRTPTTRCWSPEAVAAVNGSEANARRATQKMVAEMGAGWSVNDLKLEGNTLTYSMVPPNGKTMSVSATYHGTTYESTGPGGFTQARRIGACP